MAINIGKVTIGNLWRSHTEVFNLVARHLNHYPEMEALDVYTLIYQGTMGPSYLSETPEIFEENLMHEFTSVEGDSEKILWESIRPDGELVRVHMDGLKGRGGKAQKLITLSLWTMSVFIGDQEDFVNGWETFRDLCSEHRIRKFDKADIETITDWAEKNNYPSVRHSQVFREIYDPHYRLMKREFLNTLTSE